MPSVPWPGRSSPRLEWGFVVLIIIGLAVAVGGLVLAVRAMQRTNGWDETTGWVIEVRRTGSSDNRDWDSTIRFEDSDGIEYRFRSEYGSSSTDEGDPVTVKYPPRDPQRAQTSADTSEDRGNGLLLAAAGLAAAVWATGRTLRWWGGT